MSKKVKVTPEKKEFLVLKYRELNISLSEFCRLYDVERTAIHRWSIKYDMKGVEGLKEINKKTYYSSHTLINTVKDYLSNQFSMLEIVKKHDLSSDSVLRNWLKWYNNPKKWKNKLGEFMAREKILKQDKLNMTLEYVEKKKSAKQIAQENNVSEYQIRDWARKYSKLGESALDDKRGIRKEFKDLSSEEILKRQNKELQDKNKRLEAELLLIKKLQLLERGVK